MVRTCLLICENSFADYGWCLSQQTLGAKWKLGSAGCCKCKRVKQTSLNCDLNFVRNSLLVHEFVVSYVEH